jgi:hypothetical protein
MMDIPTSQELNEIEARELGCLREQIRDVTAERDALRRMLAAAEGTIFEMRTCPYEEANRDGGGETCDDGERCESCWYAATFALAEAVREDGDDE